MGENGILNVGACSVAPTGSPVLGRTYPGTTFKFTNRFLDTLWATSQSLPQPPITDDRSPNLWSWSGPGGWKEGLLSSLVTFGTLKGFGNFARGENLIFQHGIQGLGMILGHQLAYRVGIASIPEGDFAEQWVHAEATNLQVGAGLALGHSLTNGRIRALERGLDNSVARPFRAALAGLTPLATHLGWQGLRPQLFTEGVGENSESPLPPRLLEPRSKIQILPMVKNGEGNLSLRRQEPRRKRPPSKPN
jgi:hypothetical protein